MLPVSEVESLSRCVGGAEERRPNQHACTELSARIDEPNSSRDIGCNESREIDDAGRCNKGR